MKARGDQLAAITRRARVRRFREQVEDRGWRRQAAHAAQCCAVSLFVLAMLRSCTLDPPQGSLDCDVSDPEWSVPSHVFALFLAVGLIWHLLGWSCSLRSAHRGFRPEDEETHTD